MKLGLSVNADFTSIVYRQFLPHAKFPVFRTRPSGARERWDIVSHSLVIKITPKHRAYLTYNISNARPKRINSFRVMPILLLTFFVDTHGISEDFFPVFVRTVQNHNSNYQ